MPLNQFRTEILGEFIDSGGNVFNISSDAYMENLSGGLGYDKGGYSDLFVGIDWSNGKGLDYTVVSVLDENGRQAGLHFDRDKHPTVQINQICDFLTQNLDPRKIRCVYAEANSMGYVYIDILKDRLKNQPFDIECFNTTNTSKREIIESLAVDFENNRIKLRPILEQKNELLAYEMEMTKSGLITYNAPYGLHDDFVIALALANYGRNKIQTTSSYMISFGGNGGKTTRRHYV